MSEQYFKQLNYTLANEDSAMERAMVPSQAAHVFTVCGSGSRCLPLVLPQVELMTIVDMVEEQLWLAELRIAAVKALDRAQFMEFMGYVDYENSKQLRQEIFASLHISDPARAYFQERFNQGNWHGIVYCGKWEQTIAKIAKVNSLLTGKPGTSMFLEDDIQGFERYMEHHFPRQRWNLVLALMGNAGVFNALLYKGDFPNNNYPVSSFNFYQERFNRLFALGPARSNYMLQLLFFGRIRYLDGLPAEAEEDTFEQVKKHIHNIEFRFLHGNILDCIKMLKEPIDFLSFSDVPSYFKPPIEQSYLQIVRPQLRQGGLVVLRYYKHIPWRSDLTGYLTVTGNYQNIISVERTQVYDVDVLERAV